MAAVKPYAIVALAVAAMLALVVLLAFLVELPIADNQDFYQLYVSDLAMRYGVGLYDEAGQAALYARLNHLDPAGLNRVQWVYPPWYNLATFFLAWLPIRVAARLWFYLNLLMLSAAIALLSAHWPPGRRRGSLAAGLLFVPALGVLLIGQLVAPVLLGVALFVYGARREGAWALAAGLLLMSFKPPSGALPALGGLAWLLVRAARSSRQARRALLLAAAGGALLLAGAFALDASWPADYLGSLQRLGGVDVPSRCDSCASLAFVLARHLLPSSAGPWWLGAGLALVLLALVAWRRPPWLRSGEGWAAFAVLLTLLASPYVRNYDFVLLLVPLARAVETARGTLAWLMIIAAYLIPWLTLLVPGRPGGSEFLWIAAALMWLKEDPCYSSSTSATPISP